MNTSHRKPRIVLAAITLISLTAPLAASVTAGGPAPQAVSRVRCC